MLHRPMCLNYRDWDPKWNSISTDESSIGYVSPKSVGDGNARTSSDFDETVQLL